jgi:hypothetical protein
MRVYRIVRYTPVEGTLMKKLSISLVLALAAVTGLAGAAAASGQTQVVASPCCKMY